MCEVIFRPLPEEAPLAMPTQSLRQAPKRVRRFGVLAAGDGIAAPAGDRRRDRPDRVRRAGDVPGSGGQRRHAAGDLHAGAVRGAVRLDRAVVHQRDRRVHFGHGGRRQAPAGAGRAARQPHRAADADLQRIARSHHGRAGGDRRGTARPAGRRSVRHFHPERHHRPGSLDRGGKGVPRPARTNQRRRPDLLSAPREQHRAQGRQHRRMGRPVRRRLSAVPDPGRRQRDARRYAGRPGVRDGGASGCRPDPDASHHHRRHHAVRPDAAIRRPGVRPGDRPRHRLVARRRGQLLGPQRADPHPGVRRTGRPAGTARAANPSAATS